MMLRLQAPGIPRQLQWRLIPARPKVVIPDLPIRRNVPIRIPRRMNLHTLRRRQIKRPRRRIHVVTTKVPQCPAAETPKIPPCHRRISLMKRPRLPRPQPQIPIQPLRHRHLPLRQPLQSRIPPCRRHPRMRLPHRPNRSRTEILHRLPDPLRTVPAIPHLRCQPRLLRHPRHQPRLPHIVRQRLLTIHMLPRPHRQHRHISMRVIRRRTHDRIDRLLPRQHLPKILILRHLIIRRLCRIVPLHHLLHRPPSRIRLVIKHRHIPKFRRICNRHHLRILMIQQLLRILLPLPPRPDHRQVDLLTRRHKPRPTQHMPRHDRRKTRHHRTPCANNRLQKMPARSHAP